VFRDGRRKSLSSHSTRHGNGGRPLNARRPRGTDRTRSSVASAPYLDGTGIGGLCKTLDEREVLVRAVASDFDIDPMARAADVGVAQPMVRCGVKTLTRLDQTDTRS
jgi:hypothetical protein